MPYKNHYLTNVILRIDFLTPVSELKNQLNKEISDVCTQFFPIKEERKLQTKQVVVSNDPELKNTVVNTENLSEWHFFDLKREKELCITDKCILVDFRKYTSFNDLKTPFMNIFEVLSNTYTEVGIKRVGLRYIDQIALDYEPVDNWFNYWKQYINDDLLYSLKFVENQKNISRNMNTIEENCGTYNFRYQYGIFNTDYPAPNKKNTYILDTDVYYDGILDKEDMKKNIEIFHDEAKKLFERSITDELRRKMEITDNV